MFEPKTYTIGADVAAGRAQLTELTHVLATRMGAVEDLREAQSTPFNFRSFPPISVVVEAPELVVRDPACLVYLERLAVYGRQYGFAIELCAAKNDPVTDPASYSKVLAGAIESPDIPVRVVWERRHSEVAGTVSYEAVASILRALAEGVRNDDKSVLAQCLSTVQELEGDAEPTAPYRFAVAGALMLAAQQISHPNGARVIPCPLCLHKPTMLPEEMEGHLLVFHRPLGVVA